MSNWLEMCKTKDVLYRIQWNCKTGEVRAKKDSKTPWKKRPCGNAKHALGIGMGIIDCQSGGLGEPRYHGA